MDNELKPCPFCGSVAEVITEGSRRPESAVFCRGCDAKTAWLEATDGGPLAAIAAWNRRPEPPRREAERDGTIEGFVKWLEEQGRTITAGEVREYLVARPAPVEPVKNGEPAAQGHDDDDLQRCCEVLTERLRSLREENERLKANPTAYRTICAEDHKPVAFDGSPCDVCFWRSQDQGHAEIAAGRAEVLGEWKTRAERAEAELAKIKEYPAGKWYEELQTETADRISIARKWVEAESQVKNLRAYIAEKRLSGHAVVVIEPPKGRFARAWEAFWS
jgi:Lar family restriction alleviation protein